MLPCDRGCFRCLGRTLRTTRQQDAVLPGGTGTGSGDAGYCLAGAGAWAGGRSPFQQPTRPSGGPGGSCRRPQGGGRHCCWLTHRYHDGRRLLGNSRRRTCTAGLCLPVGHERLRHRQKLHVFRLQAGTRACPAYRGRFSTAGGSGNDESPSYCAPSRGMHSQKLQTCNVSVSYSLGARKQNDVHEIVHLGKYRSLWKTIFRRSIMRINMADKSNLIDGCH